MGLFYSRDTARKVCAELEGDFYEALRSLDFSCYSPCSNKFGAALAIGQMWSLVRGLKDEEEGGGSPAEDVEEELGGSRKYMEMYRSTGDAAYRDMAHDEARHAGILAKKYMASADAEGKARLKELDAEAQELLKKASPATA